MFKILVADDEQFIRKGITAILQRNIEEPISIIEAKNGVEAIEKVGEEQPDLIITDINMPGCSGLEFIQRIQAKKIHTNVVILSGYESFDYAKDAIALGVKAYITKPVNKEELSTLVKQNMSEIFEARKRLHLEINQKSENRRMIDGIRLDFLNSLLRSKTKKEAAAYRVWLEELQVVFDNRFYVCVMFQYRLTDDNHDYIDFMVQNILDEYLSENSEKFMMNIPYESGKLVSLFSCKHEELNSNYFRRLIREAIGMVRQLGNIQVYAGISNVFVDIEQMYKTLKEAEIAVDFKIFELGDRLFIYQDLKEGKEVTLSNKVNYAEMMSIWNECNRIVQSGASLRALQALKNLHQQVSNIEKKRLLPNQLPKLLDFSDFWSLDEMKRGIKNGLEQLEKGKQEIAVNTALIEDMKSYIDEHLSEDIDLSTLSKQFNRSSSYISTMFKRAVDGGFNAYLNDKRIERAKGLLLDPSISIKEVAAASGFYNSKYFAVVFKKNTGKTPTEYRDSTQREY